MRPCNDDRDIPVPPGIFWLDVLVEKSMHLKNANNIRKHLEIGVFLVLIY